MFCARKIVLVKQGSRITMAWCMIALFGFLARAYSADPRIAFIIRTNVNKVDVHFYTEPNRTYELHANNAREDSGRGFLLTIAEQYVAAHTLQYEGKSAENYAFYSDAFLNSSYAHVVPGYNFSSVF